MTIARYRKPAGIAPARLSDRESKVLEAAAAETGGREFAAATADYQITNSDGLKTVIVNDAITITLPAAASSTGRRILFIQKAAAILTVAQNADGAEIAGAGADYTALAVAGDRAELVCDGTEWLVVSSTIA